MKNWICSKKKLVLKQEAKENPLQMILPRKGFVLMQRCVNLSDGTDVFLASAGHGPMETHAQSYCWWFAHAGLTTQPIQQSMLRVLDFRAGAESVTSAVLRPTMSTAEIIAEVHSWFCLPANYNGSAGLDARFWGSMPLYSHYIQQNSFQEILFKSLTYIQGLRGLDLSVEQAAKLPRCLAQTLLLPLAVAAEYLHQGCGFPAVFAFDMFQACLASCQHKALEVALYAAKSKSFTCKARWCACPTGGPNAGKSPTCAFCYEGVCCNGGIFASSVVARPALDRRGQ